MADLFSIKFDTAGLERELADMQARVKSAIRPAAQAGAQVLYEEAKARVPVSLKGHWFYGKAAKQATKGNKRDKAYYFTSGTLRNAIYQVFSNDKSTDRRSTYHVAWNHQKAPYGFMVEFGTSRAPARPFLRPAFDAAGQRAVDAAQAKFDSIVFGGASNATPIGES